MQYIPMTPHPAVDILGLSARLPQSASVTKFWENLIHGLDMVTQSRWPGLYGAPFRAGVVPDFDAFDAPFFSVHGKQNQRMDPQVKKLLEVGYEAWVDSGVDFKQLSGSSRVGVYSGTPFGSDSLSMMTADQSTLTGYEIAGIEPSLFASRLSWWFNFKGPCKMIGTACSSSLAALDNAVDDITSGRVDYAMVGGSSAILDPSFTSAFVKFGMLSPEGQCRSFDAEGHGYVRSDGVVVAIVARSGIHAPRWVDQPPLCTILGIMTNNDGYTKEGITFPSGEAQAELSTQVLAKAGVDPDDVVYLEAHGTGTVAGDGQELGSIERVYGSRRTSRNPLLIGSVKSNMGHTEAASGLAGLAKLALAYENGLLPANLHFVNPNPHSKGLARGSLKVVTENTLFRGGVTAINNFGAGGTNTHLLIWGQHVPEAQLCNGYFAADSDGPLDNSPLPLASRTAEGIQRLAEVIKSTPGGLTKYHAALTRAASTVFKDPASHPVRGVIFPRSQELSFRQLGTAKSPAIWFAFSGNGSQWGGMAKDLLYSNSVFCQRVEECAAVLEKHYGYDLMTPLRTGADWPGALEASSALTAIQIGLVDVLDHHFGIKPSGFLGHSAGDIACGYVDGALSLEQTMLVAYERGLNAVKWAHGGLMASVGLSAEAATARLVKLAVHRTVVACDNSSTNVTLAGPEGELRPIIRAMAAEGVFVREVDSRGLAYHSPALDAALSSLRQALDAIIPEPVRRSKKWVSSAYAPHDISEAAATVSSQYHVQGFRNRCLFREACAAVPEGAIVVEVGPHNILRSLIRQNRPDLVQIPIMQKGKSACETFTAAICELWKHGADVAWPCRDAAPAVKLPRALKEALVAWDHGTKTPLPMRPPARSAAFTRTFNLMEKDAFLQGHVVDNRIVIPGTAYIVTVWEALAAAKGVPAERLPVTFRDVFIRQAVHADIDTPVTLAVTLDKANGFQVVCGPDLIAEGKVFEAQPSSAEERLKVEASTEPKWAHVPEETIPSHELYKDISRTGIDYAETFRTVLQASSDGRDALIRWDGEFIRFLDGLVQAVIFTEVPKEYLLRMPVRFRRLDIIDPSPTVGAGGSVPMKSEPACGSGWTSLASLEGVEVAHAPRRPSTSVTRILRRTWVPYGEQYPLSETPEQARRAMTVQNVVLSVMSEHLLPELRRRQANGTIAPHLAKVLGILGDLDVPRVCFDDIDDLADEPDCIWLRMVLDLLGSPKAVDKTLQAPIQAIVSHPEHDMLYLEDIMFGGFSRMELQVLVDTFITNAPPSGYMVCEIGAGTGGLTRALVPMLYGSVFPTPMICYVATDVTPAFGPSLLESVPFPGVTFQVWDCNTAAPPALGKDFNFVVASNAIHTCDDMATTLKHAYDILADGGFLMCYESIGPLCSGFWGLDESCWRFTDDREYSLWMKRNTWMRILKAAGFEVVTLFRDQGESRMMFLARKLSHPREHNLLRGPKQDMSEADFEEWKAETTEHFQEGSLMVEQMAKGFHIKVDPAAQLTCPRSVWLHGSKSTSPGLVGLAATLRMEPQGESIRCLYDRDDSMTVDQMLAAASGLDLVYNVFEGEVLGAYFHLPTTVSELTSACETDIPLPNGKALAISAPGNLSTLHWEPVTPPSPADGWMIPCSVEYSSLNYSDFLAAVGKAPADAMSQDLGLEFSGRLDTASCLGLGGVEHPVGTRVMGLAHHAVATKVFSHEYALWPVPSEWSLEEASTGTCAYFMVYYGLVLRAGLEPSSCVLIHAGAGSVGMAAIRVCLNRKCRVLTTVSSADKREHLLRMFPEMHADDIGDSRSTDFEIMVMRQTGGKGVDYVLHSLDHEKLKASIRCLSKFGTLVDISEGEKLVDLKLKNTMTIVSANIRALFGNCKSQVHLKQVKEVYRLLADGLASGEVTPLPYRAFGTDHVENAFRYLSTGTHIGKSIIQMDNCTKALSNGHYAMSGMTNGHATDEWLKKANSCVQPPGRLTLTWSARPGKSFIITGGLGGFGLALGCWLVQHGVTHLVLTSKRGVRHGFQQRVIASWRNAGVKVMVSTLNVADFSETQELVKQAIAMAPVGGVFHLAMVLNDGLLTNMSAKDWTETVQVKAGGATNLDIATRGQPVDVFVVFSTLMSYRGMQGQSNYTFSSECAQRVVEERRTAGLKGLAIQWGTVGNVGWMADHDREAAMLKTHTLEQQPIEDCLSTLGALLAAMPEAVPPITSVFAQPALEGVQVARSKQDLVTKVLGIMGLSAEDIANYSLAQVGIDSMQSVEVRAAIQLILCRSFPMEEVGALTLADLRKIQDQSGTAAQETSAIVEPTPVAAIVSSTTSQDPIPVALKAEAKGQAVRRALAHEE